MKLRISEENKDSGAALTAGGNEVERERQYLYWLCQVPVLGAVSIRRLWERFKSFERIYNIEGMEFVKERLLSESAAVCLDRCRADFFKYQEEYFRLKERGIRFLTALDEEYPARLKNIYDYPMGLYVKGRVPRDDIPSVAIIGARNCSSYGQQAAGMLGEELSREGIQIISGMALGIDGAGHQGALAAGGSTFAVLGSGVDVCYPKRHWTMYCQIPQNGGILSEFRLGEQARPQHFPMRNRIISGLSDAIVVVEARERSGSLITVELGLEQGKEIFAVPGMMTDELSKGCNQLIRQGASIVTSPQDILEYFQINSHKKLRLHEKNEFGLAKNEKMVYSCLDFQPKFFDQVVRESDLPVEEVMTLLMDLELRGMILQPANHYYVKKI